MRIAAIDPGLSGAACILEQINDTVTLISLVDLPIVGEKSRRRLDAVTFARWLSDHAPTHVYLENGRSMPAWARRHLDVSLWPCLRQSRRRHRRVSNSPDTDRAGDMEAAFTAQLQQRRLPRTRYSIATGRRR